MDDFKFLSSEELGIKNEDAFFSSRLDQRLALEAKPIVKSKFNFWSLLIMLALAALAWFTQDLWIDYFSWNESIWMLVALVLGLIVVFNQPLIDEWRELI